MASLASSSNHRVESVFAIQDYMERGSTGIDPSVLGAVAGAKYSKLDEYLSLVDSKSPLLYQTIVRWALKTETMTEVRKESQNALKNARDAQLKKCQDDKRDENDKRQRKLEKEALFFARANSHMCTSEEHLALISNSNAMTDNQWKQWYQYQLSIRVNGFAWDDALEGSRIVASKDEQVGFLKTRIRIEQSAQRPVTPQFPTPVFCGDTHGFAFTEDARTTDASTRLAEEAKYAAMAEHAVKQADAEKTDPKAAGGALKKAFTAIAEPAAEAEEEEGPQKKKKKRGQK